MRQLQMFVILVLAGWHVAAGQSLLPNATFDANIDGWTVDSDAGGWLEWEPVLGQPSGAIRLSGPDQVAIPDICFPAVAGTYRFRADVYVDTATADGAALCSLNYGLYESPGCQGGRAVYIDDVLGSWIFEPLYQWEQVEYDLVNIDFSEIKSLKPILNKQNPDPADDCVFDNIQFEFIPALAPAPIPTASSVGLGALAALLAVVSFVVLRRRG